MKKININVRSFGAFFLLLLGLGCFAFSAYGQTNRSSISGFVFDPQRRPVSQVPVELMNEVDSVIARTRTDGSGRFFFGGLSTGRFAIKVLPLGTNLEEQTQEVELVVFGGMGRAGSDSAQKDFYLRARRNPNEANTVTGTIFAQEIPPDAQKTYERAVADLNDKKIEAGVQGLVNALKLFPNYYAALEKLGTVCITQRRYENARDIFNRAVAVNPRSFYGWYALSYVNYVLNQSGPAIEAAQKAVSLNQNSVEALLFLGASFRQAKRYQEAEKSFKQAAKVSNGKSPDVHWNLALLYAHNLKRYQDAANELELYLKDNPDVPNAENVRKLIKQFRQTPTPPSE